MRGGFNIRVCEAYSADTEGMKKVLVKDYVSKKNGFPAFSRPM